MDQEETPRRVRRALRRLLHLHSELDRLACATRYLDALHHALTGAIKPVFDVQYSLTLHAGAGPALAAEWRHSAETSQETPGVHTLVQSKCGRVLTGRLAGSNSVQWPVLALHVPVQCVPGLAIVRPLAPPAHPLSPLHALCALHVEPDSACACQAAAPQALSASCAIAATLPAHVGGHRSHLGRLAASLPSCPALGQAGDPPALCLAWHVARGGCCFALQLRELVARPLPGGEAQSAVQALGAQGVAAARKGGTAASRDLHVSVLKASAWVCGGLAGAEPGEGKAPLEAMLQDALTAAVALTASTDTQYSADD